MKKHEDRINKGSAMIMDAVLFENWLRFYFLSISAENKNESILDVPKETSAKIQKQYPEFCAMLKTLDKKPADFARSRDAILGCCLQAGLEAATIQQIISSKEFSAKLQLFNDWVCRHEQHLEHEKRDFQIWRELFWEWAKTQENQRGQ